MSKDRKDIYLGDGLRRALAGMPGTLSTNVNLIADRYQGIVEQEGQRAAVQSIIATPEWLAMLKETIAAGRGHRIEAREVPGFPGIVQGSVGSKRPGIGGLIGALSVLTYVETVALIDLLERQP